MQTNTHTDTFLERLDQLRTELGDLAFILECQGRIDAADVANTISARLEEVQEELVGPSAHS